MMDHAKEAADLMREADDSEFTDMRVPRMISAAQVHAMLALVDELRRIRPTE